MTSNHELHLQDQRATSRRKPYRATTIMTCDGTFGNAIKLPKIPYTVQYLFGTGSRRGALTFANASVRDGSLQGNRDLSYPITVMGRYQFERNVHIDAKLLRSRRSIIHETAVTNDALSQNTLTHRGRHFRLCC